MGREGSYVHLRFPRGGTVMARVKTEEEGALVLVPSAGGPPTPVGPAPVEVGWMTWSGMVWCGGLLLAAEGLDEAVRVQLLGPPVPVERRRHVRLPVDLEVEVFPGARSPDSVFGTCVDLSPGGMQVVLPIELHLGEVVRIALRADDGDSLQVTARVARRVGPARFGFAFELVVVGVPERFARFALDQATRLMGAAAY